MGARNVFCCAALLSILGLALVAVALGGFPVWERVESLRRAGRHALVSSSSGAGGGKRKPSPSAMALVDPYAPHPDPFIVPNIVHFVFGLDPTFGHIKFGLIHYMAILGARMFIQPDAIHWHYKYAPGEENVYWGCALPALTLVPEEDVTHVHGKKLTMRVQHRADILRMQIMLNTGGMYLDSDVVALKSFEDLRRSPLSMGLEGGEGLCNAVMVGAPNTTFIQRWWAEYAHFNPEAWAYHSVQLPRELQRAHPGEVAVLQEKAFFYPSWIHLTAMYDADDGYDYHDNYAVHLWTSADPNKRAHLAGLTIAAVWEGKGSFHRIARRMLAKAHATGALCPVLDQQVAAEMAKAGPGVPAVLVESKA